MGCCSSSPHVASSEIDVRVIEALKAIKKHRDDQNRKLKKAGKPVPSDSFNRIILKFPLIRRSFSSIHRVFQAFDQDGNNSIDPDELQDALRQLGAEVTESEIKGMFRESDMQNSGALSFKEFLLCLAIGSVLQLFPNMVAADDVDISRLSKSTSTRKQILPVARSPGGTAHAVGDTNDDPPSSPTAEQKAAIVLKKEGEDLVHAFQLVLEAYLIFDADASGLIDRDEVLAILKESTSHNHASRMARGGPAGGGSSALLSEERWREMDWDSDNSITFKEFLYALYGWIGLEEDEEEEQAEVPTEGGSDTARSGAVGLSEAEMKQRLALNTARNAGSSVLDDETAVVAT